MVFFRIFFYFGPAADVVFFFVCSGACCLRKKTEEDESALKWTCHKRSKCYAYFVKAAKLLLNVVFILKCSSFYFTQIWGGLKLACIVHGFIYFKVGLHIIKIVKSKYFLRFCFKIRRADFFNFQKIKWAILLR